MSAAADMPVQRNLIFRTEVQTMGTDCTGYQLSEQDKALLSGLHQRDFISLHDFSPDEITALLNLALVLKQRPRVPVLHGQTLAMIFTKASTRTRVSFQTGVGRLGGTAIVLTPNETQIGRGEPLRDTARVLSRYVEGIMIRTHAHHDVLEFAKYADVPVINGLTDELHPCQALADLLTIRELRGTCQGLHMVYVGDGNNMAHSLLFAGAKVGMHVTVCCPAGYEPDESYLEMARVDAKPGTRIDVLSDPVAAATGADVLYTDVWASMGQEGERAARVSAFRDYQVDDALLTAAASDCLVMHCLPAHRGEEIADSVFESTHSVVFDQAENRLHAQNAIMAALMGHPEVFF